MCVCVSVCLLMVGLWLGMMMLERGCFSSSSSSSILSYFFPILFCAAHACVPSIVVVGIWYCMDGIAQRSWGVCLFAEDDALVLLLPLLVHLSSRGSREGGGMGGRRGKKAGW